jgi:hypothetical protein
MVLNGEIQEQEYPPDLSFSHDCCACSFLAGQAVRFHRMGRSLYAGLGLEIDAAEDLKRAAKLDDKEAKDLLRSRDPNW